MQYLPVSFIISTEYLQKSSEVCKNPLFAEAYFWLSHGKEIILQNICNLICRAYLACFHVTGNREACPKPYILPLMQNENKRIAYNTVLLYVRMGILVLISLYTSRMILKTLGVEDFGINNVVGGVITFLGFLTNSLAGASSRYITFYLGKGNLPELKNIFQNIVLIHVLFAGVVFLIGETVGLWFVLTQLNIPAAREHAAMWVYQLSILTSMGSLLSTPFNAAIIAHEKMSAFAYLTLGDALLKLIAVFVLIYIPADKLIFYALYMFTIQAFDFTLYILYCKRHFEETKDIQLRQTDRKLFKDIFSYAGWTMNGNLAIFGYTQGLNILLNIFFNPVVNAARGIAVQVQSIANNFCTNFQMAINPQLTKSYAANHLERMHSLVVASSKYSVYLMLLICIPLSLEADTVLSWWLGSFPDHTKSFLRLILFTSILFCLSNPIINSVHATGRIKKFQIVEGTILLLIVPISYLLLRFTTLPPEVVFFVHITVEIIAQYARLRIVLPLIQMPMDAYVRQVLCKIVPVFVLSVGLSLLVYRQAPDNFIGFLLVCASSTLILLGCIYLLGLSPQEKTMVKNKLTTLRKR